MRRFTVCTLMLALAMVATGCSSMVFDMQEPQAAHLTFKKGGKWDKTSTALPAKVMLSSRATHVARLSNIPLEQGLDVYVRVKVYGNTEFSRASMVPLVVNAEDIQDVKRGNVVRIVIVDPKRENQTERFVQLRLSPTQDAMKVAKETGKPLALVILGNRDPFTKGKASSY